MFTSALAKAMSVPGRMGRWSSAIEARSVRRGSTTTSRAPARTAARICAPMTGCASVVLEPTSRIASTSWVTSRIVFVMAPEPSVVARPVTEAEWQTRAQLSTLLVPMPARIIFWNM